MLLVDKNKLEFLKSITIDVIEESRVMPGASLPITGGNTTGITLIRPGGRNCYPSFWIRDYAMSLESGLIPVEEARSLLLLTAKCQNGSKPIRTEFGAVIPPFAVPDHINPDGKPVFFPGTYSSGKDQGGEIWGFRPPFDDQFYFIEMAYDFVKRSGDKKILKNEIDGTSLIRRLCLAFEVPPYDMVTGIIHTEIQHRGVNFGFYDSIKHTGNLLFASLLKYKAALELEYLNGLFDDEKDRGFYTDIAYRIKNNLTGVFSSSTGWLYAATGIGRQSDIWGTLFALYIGVLEGDFHMKALAAVKIAYQEGRLSYKGNVRHVPVGEEYSEKTAWECTATPFNTYQNGAFWGAPVGWLLYVLHGLDVELFSELFNDYTDELIEGDFRKGGAFGSPWECFHYIDDYKQNPVYLASVTLPYAALKRLGFY
jgi:hypothetical protein